MTQFFIRCEDSSSLQLSYAEGPKVSHLDCHSFAEQEFRLTPQKEPVPTGPVEFEFRHPDLPEPLSGHGEIDESFKLRVTEWKQQGAQEWRAFFTSQLQRLKANN